MRRRLARLFHSIADAIHSYRKDEEIRLGLNVDLFRAKANSYQKQLSAERARTGELERRLASLTRQVIEELNAPDRYDVAPDWTPDDALKFRAFLQTDTGLTFRQRLAAVGASVAIKGAGDVMHTAHSAGCAFGWQECQRWILSLSRVVREPDHKTDEARPEGEDELLERLSP